MIRLTGRMTCAPHEIDAVLAALADHVRLSRAEEGCLAFDLRQAADDPCSFDVSERFVDRAAFEHHQARTRASAWWRVTGHMARAFEMTGD